MCNTSLHHRRLHQSAADVFPFPTLHLLRTCNRLMIPTTDIQTYYNIIRESGNNPFGQPKWTDILCNPTSPETYNINEETTSRSPILDVIETLSPADEDLQIANSRSPLPRQPNLVSNKAPPVVESAEWEQHATAKQGTIISNANRVTAPVHTSGQTIRNDPPMMVQSSALIDSHRNYKSNNTNNNSNNTSPLPAFDFIAPTTSNTFPLMELNKAGVGVSFGDGGQGSCNAFPSFMYRRPRGEKRPIPDDQKDDKYYERRKRNNEAAKKSRDARKIREDRIALRAALLEQENSLLRTQVMALRDELQTLRRLMCINGPLTPRSTSGTMI